MTDWLALHEVSYDIAARRVLERVSLTLDENAPVLAIVGPSGAGKSTLLRILAGHLVATSGVARIGGESVRRPSPTRPLVFQDHNLFPWLNVLDNVAFGLKCAGVPRPERTRRGHALLAQLRLAHAAHLYPAQLSGGMQQRVGLARALAVEPACILMDEPFSALDSELREGLCVEISRLVAEQGTRLVVVTHDLADAATLADHVLVLGSQGATALRFSKAPHPRPHGFRWSDPCRERIAELRAALGGLPLPRPRIVA